MHFESLLQAIEQYASAREVLDARSPGAGSDWDCGLSGEFGESYSMSWERGRKMAEAKERLRAAFDVYVEERVRAVLRAERGESEA